MWNHLHNDDSCGVQWRDVDAVTPEFPLDLRNTSPEYFRHLVSAQGKVKNVTNFFTYMYMDRTYHALNRTYHAIQFIF